MLPRTWTTLCVMVLLFCLPSAVPAQDVPSDNNIQFNYAFVARAGDAGSRRIGVVARDTALKSGDEFKLYVNQVKPAFIYVIHKSPENELSLLFPVRQYTVRERLQARQELLHPKRTGVVQARQEHRDRVVLPACILRTADEPRERPEGVLQIGGGEKARCSGDRRQRDQGYQKTVQEFCHDRRTADQHCRQRSRREAIRRRPRPDRHSTICL